MSADRCGICRLDLWHVGAKHVTTDPQCVAFSEDRWDAEGLRDSVIGVQVGERP